MAEADSAPGEKDALPAEGEAGAPVPPDAIDPDLVRLPPPRLRRSPVLALVVVLLGAAVLYRLRADIGYALQPGAPAELGDAREAQRKGLLPPGRYVTLSGMPDLRNALAFEAKGGRARSQLFRLLGTQSRVLVVTGGPFDRAQFLPRYKGRLEWLRDLPYAAAVQAYYQREARVLRALDLARLRALPPGPLPAPLALTDRAGEPLTIQAGDELLVRVRFPDDVRVLLLKSKFPSEPDARHEVERLGLPAGPAVETRDGYGYVLRLPEGPARQGALSRIDVQGMLFQQRVETYRAPLSALRTGPEGLRVPGPGRLTQPVRYQPAAEAPTRLVPAPGADETLLPWDAVLSVERSEALLLPADALVLLDGESPAGVRWTLPVAALLLLCIAFNLWSLARGFRRPTA